MVDLTGTTLYPSRAHFTGAPVIRCHYCDYVCVYWDDDDLFDHNCRKEQHDDHSSAHHS